VAAQKLIPVNNLCGLNDSIPGLTRGLNIPRNSSGVWNNTKLEAMQRIPIYIRNLRMYASAPFETKFRKFLEDLCLEEQGIKSTDLAGKAKA
jgi:hypothetical protein